MVVIVCNECGVDVEFSYKDFGKTVKCPKCGKKIRIVDRNNSTRKALKNLNNIDAQLAKRIEDDLKFKP